MHKAKLIIGIVIITIGLTFFVNEIYRGIIDEASYQNCRNPRQLPAGSAGVSFCPKFIDHIAHLLEFLGIIGIGICFLLFGIRSVSFR